ncbi:MAG: ribosomal protein S18-alanine N-acetyltransferase [Clostridiales bacterium]|nr:ribosomal protein S18-alanine N-acetyltransferase [Eubacteriales bacterium]MDH7566918.1 ribosomal protein S18-alanine N-acetyltransferase [Clostridiales bacterium]
MTVEQLDEVMEVENLCFKIPWSRNSFIEELTGNKFAMYFTAGVNGKIVGYAGMWKVFDEGHITNVAVHPEFRRSGVGSALIEYLIETAKENGIARMTLEVRRSNLAAQKLYRKYGFKECGTRKAYYADNSEDALIMWKDDIRG